MKRTMSYLRQPSEVSGPQCLHTPQHLPPSKVCGPLASKEARSENSQKIWDFLFLNISTQLSGCPFDPLGALLWRADASNTSLLFASAGCPF